MDQRLLDINQHGVLNPPASFWWATVFLLRHWILLLVVGVSAIGGAGGIGWSYGALSWQVLAMELPMLLLIGAWVRRLPGAGAMPRALWARGREILSITAVLSVGWATWYLAGQAEWRPWPERMIAGLALVDAFILIGCWRSPLYRALFADFPEPSASRDIAV